MTHRSTGLKQLERGIREAQSGDANSQVEKRRKNGSTFARHKSGKLHIIFSVSCNSQKSLKIVANHEMIQTNESLFHSHRYHPPVRPQRTTSVASQNCGLCRRFRRYELCQRAPCVTYCAWHILCTEI